MYINIIKKYQYFTSCITKCIDLWKSSWKTGHSTRITYLLSLEFSANPPHLQMSLLRTMLPYKGKRQWLNIYREVKLSPKCNLWSFCECTRVKSSRKSIITMKAPLLRFTVFSFLGQTHFQWSARGISMIESKSLFLKHLETRHNMKLCS